MKNLKKIGAALLVVAMLCSMSVVAFADDVNAVVDGSTVTDSEIQINSAVVTKDAGILTVTLDYSITGAETGDQITMLGYIFEGEAADASQVSVVTGNIRAIDQADAVAQNGEIVFKLATTGEGYTVAEDAKMVVKLGSDAASVTKAQAFFIDLAQVTESGEPHLYGDINGNDSIDVEDWMVVLNHQTENILSDDLVEGNWQFNAADINANGGIDVEDWMIILNHQTENITSDVVGTEFIF